MNFTLAKQVSFKCISYSEDTGLFYGLTMNFNKFTFHSTLDGLNWETFQCFVGKWHKQWEFKWKCFTRAVFDFIVVDTGAVPVEGCPQHGQGVTTAHLYGEARRVDIEFLNQSILSQLSFSLLGAIL